MGRGRLESLNSRAFFRNHKPSFSSVKVRNITMFHQGTRMSNEVALYYHVSWRKSMLDFAMCSGIGKLIIQYQIAKWVPMKRKIPNSVVFTSPSKVVSYETTKSLTRSSLPHFEIDLWSLHVTSLRILVMFFNWKSFDFFRFIVNKNLLSINQNVHMYLTNKG